MPLHSVCLLQANAKGIQWRQLAPFYSQTTQLKAFGILQGCSLTPVLNISCHYWKWYIRALWSILSLCKVSKHSSLANYIKVQSLTRNCPLKFHLNTDAIYMHYYAVHSKNFAYGSWFLCRVEAMYLLMLFISVRTDLLTMEQSYVCPGREIYTMKNMAICCRFSIYRRLMWHNVSHSLTMTKPEHRIVNSQKATTHRLFVRAMGCLM